MRAIKAPLCSIVSVEVVPPPLIFFLLRGVLSSRVITYRGVMPLRSPMPSTPILVRQETGRKNGDITCINMRSTGLESTVRVGNGTASIVMEMRLCFNVNRRAWENWGIPYRLGKLH